MQNACKSLIFKVATLAIMVLGIAGNAQAGKTFMFLADWYTAFPGNTDSLMSVQSVSIANYDTTGGAAGAQGYYYGTKPQQLIRTNAYADSIPVNGTVAVGIPVPRNLARYWYALPNFNSAGYKEGKIRIYMDYWMAIHRVNTTGTGYVIQRDTAKSNGGISEYNTPTAREMDRCADSLPGDTIWVRNTGTISNNANAADLKCYNHNPFFKLVGTVHVLNPWPGKTVWAQLGTTWYPLYAEANRPGWVVSSLWANPADPVTFKVRLANGDPTKGGTVQYMDAGGLGGNASGTSLDLTAFAGKDAWVIPPTTAPTPTIKALAPPVKLTMMIHRPNWGASALRVVWQGSDVKFIAASTEFCNWFSYTLYEGAIPAKVVFRHPLADTIFGSNGLQVAPTNMSTFTNWVDLTPVLAMGGTVWAETEANKVQFLTTKPTTVTTCDKLTLAFSAYDFSKTFNPYRPFMEAGPDDNCTKSGGKETKGLVKPVLNAQGRPEWTGKVACDVGSADDGPEYWFDTLVRNGKPMNSFTCVPLPLKLDAGDGYYKYNSTNFFPLDTFKLMKNAVGAMVPNPFNNGSPNFGFCMHAKASFEYVPGLQFKFNGDDDVWVFIDKKLALDIGGQHGPVAGDIKLDNIGLTEGKSYQFDMFYCERHATGSSISIQTTMNLVPTITVSFDTVKSTGSVQDIITRVLTEQLNPGVCPELGKTTTADIHPGRSTYTLVMPDGTELGLDSAIATGYPGLTITGLDGVPNSHITVDTSRLKQSGKLVQSGTYLIRVEMGTESRSIKFSKISKVVEVTGTLYDVNGDGRGDSVFFKARDGAPAFVKPVSAIVRWANFAGKEDSVLIGSAMLTRQLGDSTLVGQTTMPFRTNCPPNGCTGDLGTVITINLGDTLRNPLAALADGIAPVADSAWLVYDTTNAANAKDTLYVIASEALVAYHGAVPTWDSAYVLAGRTGASRRVVGVADLSGATLLKILIDPANNPLQPGDSIRLGGLSGDALSNWPGALSRWVYLKAEPVAISWMLDRNGDGYPDSIGIGAKGSLAAATAAVVHWKTAAGLDTVFTVPTPTGVTTGIKLPANILKNATYCAGCYLELAMGPDTKRFTLLDSVPPVALDAKLRYGLLKDTLLITVSEPFDFGSAPGEGLAALKAAGSVDRIGTLVSGDGSGTTVLQIVVAIGTVDADSVRLRSWILGRLKKAVGQYSPFVKIEYGPQPIRVAVWDKNGDGSIDSVSYRLTRSAAGAPAVTGFGLKWGGVTVTVPNLAKSADGLSWSGAIAGPSLITAPFNGDIGWLAVGTDLTSFRATVEDSVAPVAQTAKLIFGLEAGDADTLVIAGSETMKLAASGVYALLKGTSGATPPMGLSQADVKVARLRANGDLELVVASGAIANDMDSARLGAAVSDGGKAVGDLSRWVKLEIRPSGRAYLFDADGDGRADSMRVYMRGALGAQQAELTWKTAAGATATRIWSVSPTTGSFGVRPADLTKAFDRGATFCDGCTVRFLDAKGDELVKWPLIDSVAPMAIAGHYAFGTTQDTLIATFSETLASVVPTAPWLDWGNGTIGGSILHSTATIAGSTVTFLIAPDKGAVDGWDSLRLATGSLAGSVTDIGGKRVGAVSPWAEIVYGLPPFQASLLDPNGVGAGTHVRVNLVRQVPAAAIRGIQSFRFSWTNAAGSASEDRTVKPSDLTWNGSNSWTGALPTSFALGQTGCSSNCGSVALGLDGAVRGAALIDSVPPSAVAAKFRYSTPEVGLDTLILELSEPWVGENPGNNLTPFAVVGRTSTPTEIRSFVSWSLLNNRELSVVVTDVAGAALRNGDSTRLAYLETGSRVWDAALNHVGVKSRWVPIEFGLRPPVLEIKAFHGVLRNTKLTPWEAPPDNFPQVELLQRDPRNPNSILKIDGSKPGGIGGAPINDTGKVLGIEIKINRPLEGLLIIYDNSGVAVTSIDLTVMKALWKDQEDEERVIIVAWNGTAPDHKFAASGVYLFRAVVKFQDKEGNRSFANIVRKLGWDRDPK